MAIIRFLILSLALLASALGANTDLVGLIQIDSSGIPRAVNPITGSANVGKGLIFGSDGKIGPVDVLTQSEWTTQRSTLDTQLAAKAATSHTHTLSQLSDITATGTALASAANASAARTVLGLGSLATASGVTASQITDSTTIGRSILTGVDAAAIRSALGLGSLATASSIAATSISDATVVGKAILTGADASAVRTTLGLGSLATASSIVSTSISDSTVTGRSLLTATNAAAGRTALGLGSVALLSAIAESDVTNLVSDLAGKSAVGHNHAGETIAPAGVNTGTLFIGTGGNTVELSTDGITGARLMRFPDADSDLASEAYVDAAIAGVAGGLPDPTGHSGTLLGVVADVVDWRTSITGGFGFGGPVTTPHVDLLGAGGQPGSMQFYNTDNSHSITIGTAMMSSDTNVVLPSATGTLALTSDIIPAIDMATIYPEIVYASDTIQSPLFVLEDGSDQAAIVADLTAGTTLTIKDGSGDIATRQWVTAQAYAPQGAYTSSGLTMATARLLGRTSASAGAAEEISIGSGLSLNAGQLSATGGGLGGGTGSVDNAVTRADGTGAATLQGSDISISDSTTSTANQVGFVNIHSGQTNSGVYIAPKGAGAFWLGPAATGSGSTGNARGALSVDLQLIRNAAAQVTSGQESFTAGSYNTVGGSHAAAIGYALVASGDYSFAANYDNTASGLMSSAFGYRANATHMGEMAIAGGRRFIAGDAQTSIVTAFGTTTNNTVTEIYLDGSSRQLTVPSGHCYACDIRWVAKSGANVAGGKRFCIINNNSGTTALDGAVDTIGTDHNTPGWGGITITAVDSTTDYLKIEVTGATSTTINWVVTINFTVNG